MLIAAWVGVFLSLILLDHFTLRTNGFDLSVFDYALWSTTHGPRLGFIPFYHLSLSSFHVMPTLWLLWPAHFILPSPVLLIAVQVTAVALAAVYLARQANSAVPRLAAFALVAAFLFSRRSYGATTSVFYVECLEPLLVFGFVWATTQKQRWLYWAIVLLALGCKEDMALYIASYGVLLMVSPETRTRGIATLVLSLAWVALAVNVVIPWSRTVDGVPPAYTFIVDRYGDAPIGDSLQRLFRFDLARRLLSLTLIVGWICWLRPKWLLVAAPAVLVTVAAKDETLQSGLVGHYLFPILPFVFLAALDGAAYLQAKSPKLLRAWAIVLLIGVVADNPIFAPAYLRSRLRDLQATSEVRTVLADIPRDARVLAQPQLIPHIRKRPGIECLNGEWREPEATADVVVVSTLGDQWPLDGSDVNDVIAR